MNNVSTKSLIDQNPISKLQYGTLFICFLMNMLDGMDVSIITYTALAIEENLKITPKEFGIVFSSGLFGMTLGTLFLAPFADKIGRKKIILFSAFIMGICIYLTSKVANISELMTIRFFSGIGIGSMLASTATLAAEYAPTKTRDFWVSFVISGYPIGAVIAGLVSSKVIPTSGWAQMYVIAGIATLSTIPLIYFFLSESFDFYLKNQPKNALHKLNVILNKMGQKSISELPDKSAIKGSLPIKEILKPHYKKSTIQLWIALFGAFMTLYFLTSWIPKLAKDAGLSIKLAIYSGMLFNLGAFFGIITQGYLSSKFGLKKVISSLLIFTSVMMSIFGYFVGSNAILIIFILLGFGIQGGFVGLYAVATRIYQTEVRTLGVGWAMGAGRIGSIIGPYLGGYLISEGVGISTNFLFFAIPALISGIFTYNISSKSVS